MRDPHRRRLNGGALTVLAKPAAYLRRNALALLALFVGLGGSSYAVAAKAGRPGSTRGSSVAPGSPEGPVEAQWLQANLDVVQLDLQRLVKDSAGGGSAATVLRDTQTLDADSRGLVRADRAFEEDTI